MQSEASDILGTWFMSNVDAFSNEDGILVFRSDGICIQFPSSVTRPPIGQTFRLWYALPGPNTIAYRMKPDGRPWFRFIERNETGWTMVCDEVLSNVRYYRKFPCRRAMPEDLPEWFDEMMEKNLTKMASLVRTDSAAEQASAGQTATRPVTEPEGGAKPQPEAGGGVTVSRLPGLDVRLKTMKLPGTTIAIAIGVLASGCASIKTGDHPAPQFVGGCSHDHKLPPLKLEAVDEQLLASRSTIPRKASDYYFALPASYFSIMESSPERRATFIQKDSMSDSYIHAERWFECDGGGFDLTIRVFDAPDGPLIGISSSTYEGTTLYSDPDPGPGEIESITVQRPKFWRHVNGKWISVSDSILPMITHDFVIDRYRNYYKAHLSTAGQRKFIWLSYDLPSSGNEVSVTGRENFMDPSEVYVWKRFAFNGRRFIEKE